MVNNGVKLPIRARGGLNKGELEWHPPSRMTLQNMLKNPIYAGVYTYGRRAIDPRRKVPGRPYTGRTVVAPEQCQVFLKDRFPAYISWDQYERNRERMQDNRAIPEAIGAPKNGSSLLSGLVVCGKCGNRMNVRYGGSHMRHSYFCSRLLSDYGQKSCQSLAGPPLDRFVAQLVLKSLEPASLELSLEAAEQIERKRLELDGLWQKRLERARYDTGRAVRQYNHVEPENRLVARQLEREWEGKLRYQKKLEEEYERFLRDRPRLLTAEEREAIRKLSTNIPALWESEHTTIVDRKEILRQVIDRVVIDVVGTSERVNLTTHRAGGIHTHSEMVRPVAKLEQLSYWPHLADRIREFAAQNMSAQEIAEQLNVEGWYPPKRRERFGSRGVRDISPRVTQATIKIQE